MNIHRISLGEGIKDIADKYEISEDRIYENNSELESGVYPGRELLILRPTRSYVAKGNDSKASICCRFGIKSSTLLINNPSLVLGDMKPGREYALKYGTPPYSAFAANAYFYPDTKISELESVLPYIAYLSLSTYKLSDGRLTRITDPTAALKLAKEHGKLPLMRVYDESSGEYYTSAENRRSLSSELISAAMSGGFRGITLSSYKSAKNFKAEYSEFLLELKKGMMGCDLILFIEGDNELASECAECADGCVFMYSKLAMPEPPSFEEGEASAITEFSEKSESSKMMLYLCSDVRIGSEFIPYKRAHALAARSGGMKYDEKTRLSAFSFGKDEAVLESLENTKAKLELCAELGFMGIAFDIRNVPVEYLMMYTAMFSPVNCRSPYSFPI